MNRNVIYQNYLHHLQDNDAKLLTGNTVVIANNPDDKMTFKAGNSHVANLSSHVTVNGTLQRTYSSSTSSSSTASLRTITKHYDGEGFTFILLLPVILKA